MWGFKAAKLCICLTGRSLRSGKQTWPWRGPRLAAVGVKGSDLRLGSLWAEVMTHRILWRLGATQISKFTSIQWLETGCSFAGWLSRHRWKRSMGRGCWGPLKVIKKRKLWTFHWIYQSCGFTVLTGRTESLNFVLYFSVLVFLEDLWTAFCSSAPKECPEMARYSWHGQGSEVGLGFAKTRLGVWRAGVWLSEGT